MLVVFSNTIREVQVTNAGLVFEHGPVVGDVYKLCGFKSENISHPDNIVCWWLSYCNATGIAFFNQSVTAARFQIVDGSSRSSSSNVPPDWLKSCGTEW
jgi:hypothetical protein